MEPTILHVSSSHRLTASDTPASFVVSLPRTLAGRVNSAELSRIAISNSVTTVNVGNASVFLTDDPAGVPSTATVTLTAGWYPTLADVAAEVQARLIAGGTTNAATFLCTASTTTNMLTVSNAAADFRFSFGNAATSADAYRLWGFAPQSTNTSAANTLSSTRQCDMRGAPYLLLSIAELTPRGFWASCSAAEAGAGCSIPLAGTDAGTTLVWEPDVRPLFTVSPGAHTLSVRVLLPGSSTAAPLGSEWEFELRVW